MHEIRNGIDQHAATCTDMMELILSKENRDSAKGANFRMIYANPETSWYGYYMDPKMPDFSKDKWKLIVKQFFEKYSGLARWHTKIINEVRLNGQYIGPTGRIWKFKKYKQKGGYWDYDVGQIRNYMIQGTAGDIIKLATIIASKRLQHIPEALLTMLVHDSQIIDVPDKYAEEVCKICIQVFNEIPELLKKYFNINFNLPIDGEGSWGKSWSEQTFKLKL